MLKAKDVSITETAKFLLEQQQLRKDAAGNQQALEGRIVAKEKKKQAAVRKIFIDSKTEYMKQQINLAEQKAALEKEKEFKEEQKRMRRERKEFLQQQEKEKRNDEAERIKLDAHRMHERRPDRVSFPSRTLIHSFTSLLDPSLAQSLTPPTHSPTK